MEDANTALISDPVETAANDRLAYREASAWELLAKYFRNPAVLLITLVSGTAVLYSGTLLFQFVWDDEQQIVNNPLIRSWNSLPRAFVSDLWYHTFRQQTYYRPLFVAWSILNYSLAGLRPWGWHAGAVLLHLAAVVAVFWLLRRLGIEYWTAALATLIFALHPIHIECVAWVSAASDSMATLFVALAFIAFLHTRGGGKGREPVWHFASLLLLACALLTKEIALAFSVLVGIYVWLNPSRESQGGSRKIREALFAMVPYAAVTFLYVVLRKLALRNAPFIFDAKHGYGDMALTLPYVLVFYLKQLVVPLGLTGLYYTPYVTTQFLARVVLPLFVLSCATVLVYCWSRKLSDRTVAFAGWWLVMGLAPALYIRSFGNGDFVRDRYIYLGSIGFAILAAKAVRLLPAMKGWSAPAVQATAVMLIGLAYVGVSLPQQMYWNSDLLVYARGHELYPDNPYATIGLGREYSHLGADDRAIALAEDAAKRDPNNLLQLYGLAEVYIAAGRTEQGRNALEYALRMMPDFAKSETGMASVATLWAELRDYDRALALCSEVLTRVPDLYSALYNCGNIQLLAGRSVEAEQLLRRALQAAPDLAAPRHFLGRTLLLEGRNAEAQPYLRQAAAMDPKVWDYHYWLAESFELSGNKAAALAEYQNTLQLNQGSKEAKLRLTALEGK
jgi:tetratricopeptide (TPR) repeat protein